MTSFGADDQGLRLLLTLTDEEIAALAGHATVDLPLPSMGVYDGEAQRKAALRVADRTLVARGLCDEKGALTADAAWLVERLARVLARVDRTLADRADFLLLAEPDGDDMLADVISESGYHQFVVGDVERVQDFLYDWVVPVDCAFTEFAPQQWKRGELADDPGLLDVLGPVAVASTFSVNHGGAQGFSTYISGMHAIRANFGDETVNFTGLNESALRMELAELLVRPTSGA